MTQTILVLIGTLLGVIVTGVMAMFAQHFQAQRDDRRQRRAFERTVRSEPLERIKNAVDMGVRMISLLDAESKEGRITGAAISLVPEFNLSLNGAIISATATEAQQLKDDLIELGSLMQSFARAFEKGNFDRSVLEEAARLLARIENQYIELKVGD